MSIEVIKTEMRFQAFAKEGAQVVATDINEEKLKELNGVPGMVPFIVVCCCHLMDNNLIFMDKLYILFKLLYSLHGTWYVYNRRISEQ